MTKEGCEAIATRNQQDSPLLHLPAELRVEIYKLVLSEGVYELEDPSNTLFVDPVISGHRASRFRVKSCRPWRLAILRTSRQIYAEARVLPFVQNIFSFRSLCRPGLIATLSATQRAAIKEVELITYRGKRWLYGFELLTKQDFTLGDLFPGVEKIVVLLVEPDSFEFRVNSGRIDDWQSTLEGWIMEGCGNAIGLDFRRVVGVPARG